MTCVVFLWSRWYHWASSDTPKCSNPIFFPQSRDNLFSFWKEFFPTLHVRLHLRLLTFYGGLALNAIRSTLYERQLFYKPAAQRTVRPVATRHPALYFHPTSLHAFSLHLDNSLFQNYCCLTNGLEDRVFGLLSFLSLCSQVSVFLVSCYDEKLEIIVGQEGCQFRARTLCRIQKYSPGENCRAT